MHPVHGAPLLYISGLPSMRQAYVCRERRGRLKDATVRAGAGGHSEPSLFLILRVDEGGQDSGPFPVEDTEWPPASGPRPAPLLVVLVGPVGPQCLTEPESTLPAAAPGSHAEARQEAGGPAHPVAEIARGCAAVPGAPWRPHIR